MTDVLIRKKSHKDRDMQEKDGHVTMEAEIAVMHLEAKEQQGLPVNTKKLEEASKSSPLQVSEGPDNTLISDF